MSVIAISSREDGGPPEWQTTAKRLLLLIGGTPETGITVSADAVAPTRSGRNPMRVKERTAEVWEGAVCGLQYVRGS